MKPVIVLALSTLVLTACTPPQIFYKQGVTVARLDTDMAECRVHASRTVPVRLQQQYIPPVYDYRPICHGTGSCSYIRVLISPGRFQQYDANEGLRNDVADQCMIGRRYEKISLPACPGDVAANLRLPSNRPLPPISSTTCAVRTNTGRWQVVTP